MSSSETTEENLEVKTPKGLFLSIPKEDIHAENRVDSRVRLCWSISPEMARTLKHVDDPHIVIVVSRQGSDDADDMLLAPLGEGMRYINFYRTGLNRVQAAIVYSSDRTRLRERFARRVLDWNGDLVADDLRGGAASIDNIDVDANLFGKPFPRVITKWIGFVWRTKPQDECRNWWRLLGSVIAGPTLALGLTLKWLANLLVFLLLWLAGVRKLSATPVRHFRNYTPFDVFDDAEAPWWVKRKNGRFAPLFFRFFNQVTIALGTVLSMFLGASWLIALAIAIAVLVGIGSLFVVAVWLAVKVVDRINQASHEEPIETKPQTEKDHRFDALITSTPTVPIRLTVAQRVGRLKTKHCRPFARS